MAKAELLQPALDPLWQRVELPLSLRSFPLGFPVDLATNSAAVIACARASWDDYPELFDTAPVRMSVLVHGEAPAGPLPPAVYRAHGPLLSIVCGRQNHAVCDLERGLGAAWLNEQAVSDPSYLRFYVLEAMVYAALTSRYLTALHAACIAIGGRGILLCGPSGAGKTSLAYACARRGFSYVSDDVSSLVRRRAGRTVIGKPFAFRFRENSPDLFPELRAWMPAVAPHGKPTIEVRSAELGVPIALECQADALVFLRREGAKEAHLEPIGPEEARQRLAAELAILTPASYEEQLRSLEALAGAEAFDFHYRDFDDAAECLRSRWGERS